MATEAIHAPNDFDRLFDKRIAKDHACYREGKEITMSELFPTMEQVDKADREQIARWYRFLPTNGFASHRNIMDRILERFLNMGGMTPGLSKKIGFIPNPGS